MRINEVNMTRMNPTRWVIAGLVAAAAIAAPVQYHLTKVASYQVALVEQAASFEAKLAEQAVTIEVLRASNRKANIAAIRERQNYNGLAGSVKALMDTIRDLERLVPDTEHH